MQKDETKHNQIHDQHKYESELAIISQKRRTKNKLLNQRLMFVLIIEIFVISGQILTLSLKYWYQFQIQNDDQVWINLIYVEDYYSYNYYCLNMNAQDILLCQDMKHIGYLCFIMVSIAIVLLILEIIRLLTSLYSTNSVINKKLKGKVLQTGCILLLVCTYVGYFLVIISLISQHQSKTLIIGLFLEIQFIGVSFWIGVGSLTIQILISIFYRKTKGSLFRNNQMQQYILFDKLKIDECDSVTE